MRKKMLNSSPPPHTHTRLSNENVHLLTIMYSFRKSIDSNQIIFIGLRSSKDYYKRSGGGVGIWEWSLGWRFCVGRCVLREWVVGGGGLDEYFGEQGLPADIQECLERFLSRQFVPKWDCPSGEGELATARTASLLVELECVVA